MRGVFESSECAHEQLGSARKQLPKAWGTSDHPQTLLDRAIGDDLLFVELFRRFQWTHEFPFNTHLRYR